MKANHKQKLFQEPKLKNHHKKNQTCINKNNIRKVIPKETRKKLKLTNHNFLKFLDGDEKSHLVLTFVPYSHFYSSYSMCKVDKLFATLRLGPTNDNFNHIAQDDETKSSILEQELH